MPRVRFTVRRMMAVVAVAGTIFAIASILARRSDRFARLRDYHAARAPAILLLTGDTVEKRCLEGRRQAWHWEMFKKYDNAARLPWLPVEPDGIVPK